MLLGRPLHGRAGGCAPGILEGLGMADPDPGILSVTSLLVSASAQLSDADLTEGARDVLGWMTVPLSASAELAASIRWALLVNLAAASQGKCLLLHVSRLLLCAACCDLAAMPGVFHPCFCDAALFQSMTYPAGQKEPWATNRRRRRATPAAVYLLTFQRMRTLQGTCPALRSCCLLPQAQLLEASMLDPGVTPCSRPSKLFWPVAAKQMSHAATLNLQRLLGIQACKDTATHQLPSSHKASPTSWRMQQHHAAAGMSHGSPLAVLLG